MQLVEIADRLLIEGRDGRSRASDRRHRAGEWISYRAAFAHLAPLGSGKNLFKNLPVDLVRRRKRSDWCDSRRAFVETPEQVSQKRRAGADHARSLFNRPAKARVIIYRLLEGLHIEAVVSYRLVAIGNRAGDTPGVRHLGAKCRIRDLFDDCVHWLVRPNGYRTSEAISCFIFATASITLSMRFVLRPCSTACSRSSSSFTLICLSFVLASIAACIFCSSLCAACCASMHSRCTDAAWSS